MEMFALLQWFTTSY